MELVGIIILVCLVLPLGAFVWQAFEEIRKLRDQAKRYYDYFNKLGSLRMKEIRELYIRVEQLENPPLDVVVTEKPIVISEEPQIEPAFYDDDWQVKKYKELANIQAELKVKGLL